MPTSNDQHVPAGQVVFSICASAETSDAILSACTALPGSAFEGGFHEYFTAERRPQLSQALKEAASCIALVDCDSNADLAIETMIRLRALGICNLHIVAVATKVDADYLLSAMRSGCNEFLTKPTLPEEISSCLLRFHRAITPGIPPERPSGRVISLFGAKGGVGTTTLAVHLADALVRLRQKRTLLIDGSNHLGHVGLFLGLKESQYHFGSLLRNANRLDADLLAGFVMKHCSGLDVLPSSEVMTAAAHDSPDDIERVLQFLKLQYDYIVFDASLADASLAAALIQGSDDVCFISTPEVPSLRDLARRLEFLSQDATVVAKIRVVVNRSTLEEAISIQDIQTAIRLPISGSIPNHEPHVTRAINLGELIPVQSRSPFTQQIKAWMHSLLPDATASSCAISPTPPKRFAIWGRKPAIAAAR